MTHPLSRLSLAALTLASAMGLAAPVAAQVAGATTTVEATVTESTRLAMGWSVKKTLMGKTIYNEAGDKVGKVDDLIISPDKNVSFVIVGAGGFIGIGRHDVAIPVTQIQTRAGKLVMTGATKDMIKNMPQFEYAADMDTTKRDNFVAAADKDIARGKVAILALEKMGGVVASDAKVTIDADIIALRADVSSAEGKLAELKDASAARWKEFEAGVNTATARLRKATDKATDKAMG